MARNLLERAAKLYRRGKYSEVISLLEPIVLEGAGGDMLSMYKQSFDLFFLLGMSCLYTGDIGGTWSYLERADKLMPGNSSVGLARAVAAIIQGKIPDACGYYLEVLRRDPDNKKAINGLEFLRKADDETVRHFVVSNKIFRFCPSKRRNRKPVLIAAAVVACLCLVAALFFSARRATPSIERADLSAFTLSQDERQSAVEQEGSFKYVLSSREVLSSYERIKTCFNDFRDNAAQVEINRLLNSNASASIRRKARMLMDYLSEPEFSAVEGKDAFSYSQVAADPALYADCWVRWEGMAANVAQGEDSTDFNFLVGYNRNSDLEGIVQVHFDRALSFDVERPFELFAQIKNEGAGIVLQGRAIHQQRMAAASGNAG